MTDSDDIAARRARLSRAGFGGDDLRWLDGVAWNPDSIPAIGNQADYDAYARRERAISASIDHLTFAEKAASADAMLAATLGARMADWRDRDEDEE